MEAAPNSDKIFIGSIIHCTGTFSEYTLDIYENGFIIVRNQIILAVDRVDKLEERKKQFGVAECEEVVLSETQVLIPGLIDTHIHASQYPNVGLGYTEKLLDWLEKYTFKLEKRFQDLEFAKKVYDAVVAKTISCGTTTACYFATLYLESTLQLVESVVAAGQRALIGKVCMTEMCPDDYKENEEESVANTCKFVQAVLAKQCELVQPVITPRFALSCTRNLMRTLGGLAKEYDLHIQSHISENIAEVELVERLFGMKYAEVYDDADILTSKTVLAHGVYLDVGEMKLLAKRGTSVSHCPASNCYLQSGSCDVKSLAANGVTVGLGTDVSGGPFPSMIATMRSTLENSIYRSLQLENYTPLSCYDVFYLATLGGAKALALEDKIGNFQPNKQFDAIVVDMNVENGAVDYFESLNNEQSKKDLLQRFIYCGDDRNVIRVYVAGKLVK